MANTYELITSSTVGSGGAASVTFSSIPQTYTDLLIFSSYRGAFSAPYDQLRINVNGTNSWAWKGVYGDGASAGSETNSGQTTTKVALGVGSTATANTFSNDCFYIPNYTSSNYKSISADSVGENNATTAYAGLFADLNSSTTAITSITLASQNGGNLLQYSSFYLYGIKNS